MKKLIMLRAVLYEQVQRDKSIGIGLATEIIGPPDLINYQEPLGPVQRQALIEEILKRYDNIAILTRDRAYSSSPFSTERKKRTPFFPALYLSIHPKTSLYALPQSERSELNEKHRNKKARSPRQNHAPLVTQSF